MSKKRKKLDSESDDLPSNKVPRTEEGETSSYKKFLNALPIKQIPKRGKPKSIGLRTKQKWQDVSSEDQGNIINEIVKKFETSTIDPKIDAAKYFRDKDHPSYYFINGDGKPELHLVPEQAMNRGPNPSVVGHELVHANDHQIDHLNPKVWEHLKVLANTGNNNSPMRSFEEFNTSIGKIQDKIDPTGAFKPNKSIKESGYPIDQEYIKSEIRNSNGLGGNSKYKIPLLSSRNPNWTQLFTDINNVVTYQDTDDEIPNPYFYLNRASEFPAFMSERLTERWRTNEGENKLSQPEATFLYNTLGNMAEAYPAESYPVINRHILARRNSINSAYQNSFDHSNTDDSNADESSSVHSSNSGSNDLKKGGLIKLRSKKPINKQGISNFLKKLNNYQKVNFINAHQYI